LEYETILDMYIEEREAWPIQRPSHPPFTHDPQIRIERTPHPSSAMVKTSSGGRIMPLSFLYWTYPLISDEPWFVFVFSDCPIVLSCLSFSLLIALSLLLQLAYCLPAQAVSFFKLGSIQPHTHTSRRDEVISLTTVIGKKQA
jgi:hypothetical protein